MRFLLVVFVSIVLAIPSFAQKKSEHAPKVEEGTRNMYQGSKNALTVTLRDADDKIVEKLWDDLIKNYKSKLKKVKKADVEMAENVRIQSISGTGNLNLYSKIEEQGDDVILTVWFEMSNGNFLNSAEFPNSYKEAEEMLENFGVSVKRRMVQEELEDEQDALGDLNKNLEKMIKRKENLEKDIEDYKKRIEDAKKEIEDNLSGQEDLKKKIEEQKSQVEAVNKRLGDIQ
ncbi:MAG: hypothetical protein KDC24_00970 [Saprospiraceae bacterium]|nr:hypothetical protein [Saprospiraceae bacterium]